MLSRAYIKRTLSLALLVVASLISAQALAQVDVPESAYAEGALDDGDARAETRLLVDAKTVAAGDEVRVGVLFDLDPEWHVYWRNSGEAGLATRTEFGGDGLKVGELQWPAPHVFDMSDEVTTFGYGERVLFFAPATVEKGAEGELTVTAKVDYLACKIDCIPGNGEMTRTLAVADEAEAADEEVVALFDEFESRVPVEPTSLGIDVEVQYSQKPVRPGDAVRAALGLTYCKQETDDCEAFEVEFDDRTYAMIPGDTSGVDWKVAALRAHPTVAVGQVLDLEGEASANAPSGDERFSGVVHLKGRDGTSHAILIDEPITRGERDAEVEELSPTLIQSANFDPRAVEDDGKAAASSGSKSTPKPAEPIALWYALLLAFGGGLILNLMPCVFPVLAIKVTSFTQVVHKSKATILSHGAAYTGGIVGSMMALGLVVVGLRVAGKQVGWGFQFQEPLFIVALCAILVLFALNLFGVFEVSVAATDLADKAEDSHGLRRSFMEGVLAVVLATPCSAPFLGTAVGFALASSAFTILAVFFVLGLGLAAPFVVLTLSPGWAKVLPRPGNWMNVLKQLLGFALLGTVIWLFWILGGVVGANGLVQLLVFLSVLALGAWFYGMVQYKYDGLKKLGVAVLALAVVAGTGVYVLDFEAARAAKASQTPGPTAEGEIEWEPWTEAAVQAELDKGRVVFVDFTANWCITCKMNERTILNTEEVKAVVEENDVAMFKADWTEPDERIRAKLSEFGKGGVPMYLVYRPGREENPEVLPEVLTKDIVISSLTE
ncbi:MAG: protein-disulfide reductase DsbD family protein [Myxococcota bacterium]